MTNNSDYWKNLQADIARSKLRMFGGRPNLNENNSNSNEKTNSSSPSRVGEAQLPKLKSVRPALKKMYDDYDQQQAERKQKLDSVDDRYNVLDNALTKKRKPSPNSDKQEVKTHPQLKGDYGQNGKRTPEQPGTKSDGNLQLNESRNPSNNYNNADSPRIRKTEKPGDFTPYLKEAQANKSTQPKENSPQQSDDRQKLEALKNQGNSANNSDSKANKPAQPKENSQGNRQKLAENYGKQSPKSEPVRSRDSSEIRNQS
ncbi:MAG: hypothetical protein SAL07_07275 [Oscillatoria sp. PMC 1051.18]|nr:hypothetical protein [Oscillatoria sp. PMC 1050.18]MEC5029697.1 hypothetical protein [Oscillatoria sp. PMC 1051.18]